MKYTYKTKDTCSTTISFELEGDIVRNIVFTGGCSGNLRAIQKLVDGFTVEQIEEKLSGLQCGMRPTSCGDQLSKAVRAAYQKAQK